MLGDVKGSPDTARFTRTVVIDPIETCRKPLQVFRDNNGAAVVDFEVMAGKFPTACGVPLQVEHKCFVWRWRTAWVTRLHIAL